VFEKIEFFGKIEDVNALPMSGGKSSVLPAFFGNYNFTICLGQFCIYFLLAHWADAFGFLQKSPPIVTDSASIIRDNGNKIIDIVIRRSNFRTFSTVATEVMRRIEEPMRRMLHGSMRGK
jgi:hypothetical protein